MNAWLRWTRNLAFAAACAALLVAGVGAADGGSWEALRFAVYLGALAMGLFVQAGVLANRQDDRIRDAIDRHQKNCVPLALLQQQMETLLKELRRANGRQKQS